jgi:hypothetical protein
MCAPADGGGCGEKAVHACDCGVGESWVGDCKGSTWDQAMPCMSGNGAAAAASFEDGCSCTPAGGTLLVPSLLGTCAFGNRDTIPALRCLPPAANDASAVADIPCCCSCCSWAPGCKAVFSDIASAWSAWGCEPTLGTLSCELLPRWLSSLTDAAVLRATKCGAGNGSLSSSPCPSSRQASSPGAPLC